MLAGLGALAAAMGGGEWAAAREEPPAEKATDAKGTTPADEPIRELIAEARKARAARHYSRAEQLFVQALQKARESGQIRSEIRISIELAGSMGTAGAPARAAPHAERAVELARAHGDPKLLGQSLRRWAEVINIRGDTAAAERALEEASEIYRRLGDDRRLTKVAITRSRFANHRGDYRAALEHGESLLDPERPYRVEGGTLLDLLSSLAYAHQKLGNFDAAEDHYDRLVELAFELGSRSIVDFAHCNRAEVRWQRGAKKPALEDLERAVAGFEEGRAGILESPEARAEYLHRQVKAFDRLVRFRADTSSPGRAFEAAERFHGRSFLELLDAEGFELLVGQRGAVAPNRWTAPEPPSLPEIRRALEPGEVLITYWVGEEQTLAWIVRAGDTAEVPVQVRLPISRQRLEQEIDAFLRPLYSAAAAADLALTGGEGRHLASGEQLHRWLVKSLPEAVAAADSWIVIPDGPLHRLPFGALVEACEPSEAAESGAHHDPYRHCRFLGLEKALAYSPSAAAFVTLRQRRLDRPARPRSLLALAPIASESRRPETGSGPAPAVAPLVHGRAEVERAAALYEDSEVLIGERATEANLRRRIERWRYLHFATHGRVDDEEPLDSAVQLTPSGDDDGWLRASEVLGLRLEADLVVLSACRSGRGRWRRGEGFYGLGQAFLAVGASALVSSLWDVDDEATSLLMAAFYRHLAAGARPAEALRRARRELSERTIERRLAFSVRETRLAHPRFWAAFLVLGDG